MFEQLEDVVDSGCFGWIQVLDVFLEFDFFFVNCCDGFVVLFDVVYVEVVVVDQYVEDVDLVVGDYQVVYGLGGVVDWNGIGLNFILVFCFEWVDCFDFDVFVVGGFGVDFGGYEVVLLVVVVVFVIDDFQVGFFGQQVDDVGFYLLVMGENFLFCWVDGIGVWLDFIQVYV